MVSKEVAEAVGGLRKIVPSGTSVLVEGELSATPEGTKQVRMCGGVGSESHASQRKQAGFRA